MEHIPVVNSSGENFQKDPAAFIEFAMRAAEGPSARRNDRERPYDGQPWTYNGLRGKTLVEGLTMRDIRDCFVQAILVCAPPHLGLYKKVEEGTWSSSDLYGWDLDQIDPLAVAQNLTCNIEKMMGIFPNIKGCPTSEEILKGIAEMKEGEMLG
jgi:hypothetical protein